MTGLHIKHSAAEIHRVLDADAAQLLAARMSAAGVVGGQITVTIDEECARMLGRVLQAHAERERAALGARRAERIAERRRTRAERDAMIITGAAIAALGACAGAAVMATLLWALS